MKDKTEILLSEYETCQSHNNAIGNQTWISISILITVNLLILWQVTYNLIFSGDELIVKDESIWVLVIVGVIGIIMIYILILFKKWHKRIDFMVWINNERMRQIETILEMWKNWRVYGLDLKYGFGYGYRSQEDWELLTDSQKSYIENLSERWGPTCKHKYEPPTTRPNIFKFDNIFPFLIGLWVVVIVFKVLIRYCPAIQGIIYN